MAIKCISFGGSAAEARRKFILDTEADVASLPACCAGSVAIVAEGGKAYMVNASGKWVLSGTATFNLAEEASF